MPVCLASRVSCAAHSRTCATDPGAELSCSDHRVWIESITATCGPQRLQRGEDLFEIDLGQQLQLAGLQRQAPRAHGDLLARFLAADVEHIARRTKAASACSSSVLLPIPGSPPISTTPPADQPAAERAIELADAGRQAIFFARFDGRERLQSCRAAKRREAPLLASRGSFGDGLDERVPDAAAGALPLPLGGAGTALGTRKNRLPGCPPLPSPCSDSTTGTRRASAQNSS
jgi:hypothetical protein